MISMARPHFVFNLMSIGMILTGLSIGTLFTSYRIGSFEGFESEHIMMQGILWVVFGIGLAMMGIHNLRKKKR